MSGHFLTGWNKCSRSLAGGIHLWEPESIGECRESPRAQDLWSRCNDGATTGPRGPRVGPTLRLTLSAVVLSLLGGMVFGALAGLRHGSWKDLVFSLFALMFHATPVFWLGLMLVLVFSIQLEWFPAFGHTDVRAASYSSWQSALDVAHHLVLPASLSRRSACRSTPG